MRPSGLLVQAMLCAALLFGLARANVDDLIGGFDAAEACAAETVKPSSGKIITCGG
jgi:hypothetical protein